jgi:hypothetical protein
MKTAVRDDVRSEESSKPTNSTDTILKQAWLKRTKSNQTQKSILSKLQASLGVQITELAAKKMRCGRLQADLVRMIDQGTMKCMEGDIDALALRLIAGEDLVTVVSDATQGMGTFYAKVKASLKPDDKEDADVFEAVDFSRASVMILEQAVVLQKRNLVETHKASMAEFLPAIKEARGTIALQFLAALEECQKAAERDRLFAEGLEPDEIQLLNPRPFPTRILSEDVLRWLFAAANEDLIRREDLHSARIDL